jgi:dolichyl-phosphate-mannose--protein O-mannosyl transferase
MTSGMPTFNLLLTTVEPMPTASAVDEAAPAPSTSSIEALGRIQNKLLRPLPDDRLRGWLLPLAVALLGGIARFWRITRPGGHTLPDGVKATKGLVFDETYYAHDSWTLLHHGVELNGAQQGPGFVVHPPLGKWMMSLGEAVFDHGKTVVQGHTVYPASPLSFRVMGALLGTIAILILARTARRMFRSTALGVIAGVLLSLDGLEFVQSRTAMLDIYLMFWIVAAFACLVADRDDGRRRLAARLNAPLSPSEWGPSLGFRPWRFATVACLGAACATKWDGAFYIPAFLILAVAWDFSARRTAGSRDGLWRGVLYAGGPALIAFVLVPAAVYVAAWTGWFISDGAHAYDHDRYITHGQSWFAHDRAVLRGWWHYQHEIWGYDDNLTWTDNPHPYLSRPWGWLLLARPVAYYYKSPIGACGSSIVDHVKTANDCSQEILGIGNPALWWASIGAIVAAGWAWLARRDWRGAAIIVAFGFGFLPWFFEDTKQRVMFLFYMLPNVPFMVLAVTMVIGAVLGKRAASVGRRAAGVTLTGLYLATVLVLFGYFYPVLAARTITYDQWHSRMWLHHCQAQPDKHTENAPCWI